MKWIISLSNNNDTSTKQNRFILMEITRGKKYAHKKQQHPKDNKYKSSLLKSNEKKEKIT